MAAACWCSSAAAPRASPTEIALGAAVCYEAAKMLRARPTTVAVLALGATTWLIASAVWWLARPPLGHDEAQYVLAFGDWLAGRELRWVYLSRGMHAIAGPGVLLGGSELALRAAPFLCGLGFLAVSARLAWRLHGPTTAAWTVAILATSAPLLRRSAELLSDLPAAALLLAATLILVEELVPEPGGREQPSWRVVWVAPLFAAAFYIRYASCVPAAILGLACAAAGWRNVLRRPAPLVTAVGLLLLLLVPHFLDAIHLLGSPLAILLESQRVPRAEVSGLTTYLTAAPRSFYGTAVAPLLVVGVLSIGWFARRLWRAPAAKLEAVAARRGVLLWLIAVGDIVAIGLTALGQMRYILVGIVVLLMLGVELLRSLLALPAVRWQRAAAAAALAVLAVLSVQSVLAVARHGMGRDRLMKDTMDTIELLHRDAAGRRCHFLAAAYTQIEWYTGCNGHNFSVPEVLARGEVVYYVANESWQPSPAERAWPHRVILERQGLQVLKLEAPEAPR